MSIILLEPLLNLIEITNQNLVNQIPLVGINKHNNFGDYNADSKWWLGLMKIVILLISILAVGSLSIILFAELNLVNQNMSTPSTGLDVINITSVGSKTNTSAELSNKQISEAIEGGDNVGRIASIPKKCLGSALCPD